MKTLFFSLLTIVIFSGCKGDNFYFGTDAADIRYINQSNDAYDIYLGTNKLKELPAHQSHTEHLGQGLYSVKAVQTTNIVGTPNVIETSIALNSGTTKDFIFP